MIVKMATTVGILIFLSRKKFILSRVEHEFFITSGSEHIRIKMEIHYLFYRSNFVILSVKG